MAKQKAPQEVQDWMAAASAAGWRVERTQKSHYKFFPPDTSKGIVTVEGTPSDHRSIRNTRSRLRAAGLPI